MRIPILVGSLFLVLGVSACKSTACCDGSDPQAVVESVAKQHPDCTRLTVHCTKPGATGLTVCASTAANKQGKPSDPEDLKAMQTGEVVVLDEAGALDVTVPILAKDGKCTAACGVTMKTAMPREQAIERAKTIAKAVEAGLGSCCCGDAK